MTATLTVLAALRASPGVVALAGNRIYAGRPPQDGATPDVAVVLLSSSEPYALDGASGLVTTRFVVMARGDTYAAADQLGEAVVNALRDYRLGGVTIRRDVIDRTEFVEDAGHLRMIGFEVTRSV